jgi:hypothetical protein
LLSEHAFSSRVQEKLRGLTETSQIHKFEAITEKLNPRHRIRFPLAKAQTDKKFAEQFVKNIQFGSFTITAMEFPMFIERWKPGWQSSSFSRFCLAISISILLLNKTSSSEFLEKDQL